MDLGHRLLDQRHPQLLALRLRVHQMPPLVARQQIIHQHRRPLPVLAEAHLVRTLAAYLLGHQHLLHQILPLGQHGQGAEQPTVAQHALANVRGQRRPEDRPRRIRPTVAVDLVRSPPLHHRVALGRSARWVVVEALRGRRERVVDEELVVVATVLDDVLPLGQRLGLLQLAQVLHQLALLPDVRRGQSYPYVLSGQRLAQHGCGQATRTRADVADHGGGTVLVRAGRALPLLGRAAGGSSWQDRGRGGHALSLLDVVAGQAGD